jgi:WD40 repeat protein
LTDVDRPDAAPISLLGNVSSVNSLSFGPRGDFLASASSDGKVRLWNLADKNSQPVALGGHEKWVWAVAFTPDGSRLVSGSEDRTARVWPARTALMAGELCQAVHRGLTPEEWKQYMPADLAYQGQPPCPASR